MGKLPVRLALLTLLCGPVFAQTAQVRHAPTLNGTVEGSVQVMTAEDTTLNGGAVVKGDLLVPGTPAVRLNGTPTYGGTVDGPGATTPTSHKITLNGRASLGHVIRRTDAVTLPTVAAPPPPAGTRGVSLNQSGQSPGDFATLRDLTLNGSAGAITVPPGAYGDFTANGGSFTLGVAGATTPAVYAFQHLALNGASRLDVAGPVIVTVANAVTASGNLGNSAHPDWLTLKLAAGGLTLNGNVSVYGYVTAPSGKVTLNGNSQLVGGLIADQLTLNGTSLLRLLAPPTTNQPPTVTLTAPADGATFTAPANFTFTATAADAVGTVAKVEFFQGSTKLGEDTSAPFTLTFTLTSQGSLTYPGRGPDNTCASADSAAVNVTVTSPNQPPTVALTSPADGTLLTAPAALTLAATASDPDGAIGKVEFYQGTTKLGEDLTAPYDFAVTGLAVGTYAYSAQAYDLQGLSAASAPATVTVIAPNQPPTVALTAPADGASFTAPAAFALTATATDSDGTIAKVEFFQNATKLGEVASAPFTFPLTLTLTSPGSYSYLARATDNTGSATDSAPVAVTVIPPVSLALPFLAGFESAEGYTLGPINGQQGWTASSLSVVTDADFATGARSVLVPGQEPPLSLTRAFDPHPGQAVVFVDLFALPQAAADATASAKLTTLNAAQAAFVRDGATGRFQVFNGDGAGSGSWQATLASIPVDAAGYATDWVRVTLRLDYPAKKWDLYVGGVLAAADVGFAQSAQTGLGSFTLTGQAAAPTLLDDFLAAFGNPLFTDADHDGMDDAWETAHGLNPAVNDRNGDPDQDGLTNLQEYLLGANPNNADTDGDGMKDGWENQYGLNPLANDASADSDGDGVSNLFEFLQGRNPTKGAVPDTTGAVNLRVFQPDR